MINEGEEGVVNSPKPDGLTTPLVVVDDNCNSSQHANPELGKKKRKSAETAAERIARKVRKLRAKNKEAFMKPAAACLQSNPRVKEEIDEPATPSAKPDGLLPDSANNMTFNDILNGMDGFQKQDKLLDCPVTSSRADPPGEDATKLEESAPKGDAPKMTGLPLMKAKVEERKQALDKPRLPNPFAQDNPKQVMKPGDLLSSLPPLPSQVSSFVQNSNSGQEELANLQSLLGDLEGKMKELEGREEAARTALEAEKKARLEREKVLEDQVEAARTALEVERKARLGKEKVLTEQNVVLTARLDKEKKAVLKFDGDCRYYQEKYLRLTKEVRGSRRHVNDERMQISSRPTVGGDLKSSPG